MKTNDPKFRELASAVQDALTDLIRADEMLAEAAEAVKAKQQKHSLPEIMAFGESCERFDKATGALHAYLTGAEKR